MEINYEKCMAYVKNSNRQCQNNQKIGKDLCGIHFKSKNLIRIETMVDGGDCEDKSILLVSILDVIDIDAELLRYSDHMAVMVDGCYVETTVKGCDCKAPVGYKGLDPVVYNLENRSIISIKWKADFYHSNNELWVDANIIVGNYGNMISDNIILKINNTSYKVNIGVVDMFSIKKINFVKPVNSFDFEVLL